MRSQMFQQFGGQPNPRYGFEEYLPDDMFKEQAERALSWALLSEMIAQVRFTSRFR